MGKTCAECDHYVSIKSEAEPAEKGACRRYPPRLFVTGATGEKIHTGFPEVPGSWGCGEFRSNSFAAKRRRNVKDMGELHKPAEANGSYDGEKAV
jgi:hypothetical protein